MKIQTMQRTPVDHSAPSAVAASAAPAHRAEGSDLRSTLGPLILDVAIPLGSYYVLKDVFGVSLVMSLALSSVVPAARSVVEFVKARKIEALAILMVAVNVAGIVISFTTGNARMMIAKDSVVSSVIGLGILFSAWRGQPLMSAGLKPFATKGKTAKVAAWDRLHATSRRFQSLERRYSLVWGLALLADSVARVIGAFALPVSTMVWMSTVMVIVAVGIAAVVGGGVAADPIEKMVAAEAEPQRS